MAKTDWANIAEMPEERLAKRLAKQFGLKPPIDVFALINEFADCEEDSLPFNCDAIFLDRKNRRPLVLLDKNKPIRRRHFTLAHEIGHIVIPWHVGTVVCNTKWIISMGDALYRTMEAEANRFAAELLMPLDWLKKIFSSGASLPMIYEEILNAGVTDYPAVLSLGRAFHPGYIFALVDDAGQVVLKVKTKRTALPTLPDTDRISVLQDSLDKISDHGTFKGFSKQLYWWELESERDLPAIFSAQSSTEILRGVISDIGKFGEEATLLFNRINGVVGATHGGLKPKTKEEFFAALSQRFIRDDPAIRSCVAHSEFQTYLVKRCEEVFSKKKR